MCAAKLCGTLCARCSCLFIKGEMRAGRLEKQFFIGGGVLRIESSAIQQIHISANLHCAEFWPRHGLILISLLFPGCPGRRKPAGRRFPGFREGRKKSCGKRKEIKNNIVRKRVSGTDAGSRVSERAAEIRCDKNDAKDKTGLELKPTESPGLTISPFPKSRFKIQGWFA